MISYLKKTSIMALAVVAATLLAWLLAGGAGTMVNAAQGAFAPAAQEAAPQAAEAPAPEKPNIKPMQSPGYEAGKVYVGERISLDFQNADIHNIIRIIGDVSGKNIVVSDAVSGKVTLKLKDVPWDQALDIVLSSRNLGYEDSGNVLTIYDLPTLQSKRAGQERIAAERAAALALAPLAKKIFTPKYAPINSVTEELSKLKSARGKIVAIGNDIYVEDEAASIMTMSDVFMRVDKVARQILIEARIIEASTSFAHKFGIDWGANYNKNGQSSGTPGHADGSLDITSGATRLDMGFLNKASSLRLKATLNASETSNQTRTLSAPRIMAANDQKVSIKQGQQVAYTSGSSANTAANVQFKEVVMELEVTPHIEENGQIITLDIKLTNDTLSASSGSSGEPDINTKEAETMLMVKDGETVVIGGILVDTMTEGTSRVPGVHRLPLLGWMFKSDSISNDKSEMLILITANIIPVNI